MSRLVRNVPAPKLFAVRMASKVLAEAVKAMIESGHDQDWVLGGDYNAELARGLQGLIARLDKGSRV